MDPSIGRFRNLIQTTVIPVMPAPSKKLKLDINAATTSYSSYSLSSPTSADIHKLHPTILSPSLYAGLPPSSIDLDHQTTSDEAPLNHFGSKLGLLLPNPAPEISVMENQQVQSNTVQINNNEEHPDMDDEPRKKKKYAKEVWPKLARKNNNFNIKTN